MSRVLGQNVGQPNIGNQDYYVYGATVSSLAAAASTTFTTQIEADANFHALKLTYFATLAGAAVTDSTRVLPLVTIQITDQGSGRNLFNQAVPIPAVMGSGELPYIIPLAHGRQFRANSAILFTLTNYSAATTYRLDFALSGVKKWS